MIKAEVQHGQVQNQPTMRQGRGAAVESPGSAQIAQLEAMIDASPQMSAQRELAAQINTSPAMAAQRKFVEGLGGSPRMATRTQAPAQLQSPSPKPNHTGLPDNLKSGIENLSGMSMDHVKVHYNSSQPAQLNALAYAQGADIHVAPGQEQHLPHEAWHVVQQAQGRVQPTMQMKDGVQRTAAFAVHTPVVQRQLRGGMTTIGKFAISLHGGKLFKIVNVTLEDYDEADRPIPSDSPSGEIIYELQDATNQGEKAISVGASTDDYENAVDLPFLGQYVDAPLGASIGGSSSEKNVYLLQNENSKVIGISKLVEDALIRIREEAAMLGMLANRGIPVVHIEGITTHNGAPALIMRRYAEGSKDTVTNDKKNFNKPVRKGNSDNLNAKSIIDLNKIMKQSQREKVRIDDIQFLIGSDGSVVVADPLSLDAGNQPPTSNMIQMIMRLMEAAAENVLYAYFKAHDRQTFTRKHLTGMLLNLKVDQYSIAMVFDGFMKRFGGVIQYDSNADAFTYNSLEDVD